MNPKDPVVITGFARTPMGGFQGDLASLAAPQLGGAAIRAACERSQEAPAESSPGPGLSTDEIDEVVMGCVLSAGLGQAPARQAALDAGFPKSVGATTVNKMCGSGMQAAIFAHDAILAGSRRVVVAGGMESMSNAPYLLPKARAGLRLGHAATKDHMFLDGLEDAYEPGRLMGSFAEDTARHFGFSRQAQDEFAISSLERALMAESEGAFSNEIIAVKAAKGVEVASDEQPAKARPERIPALKPAFAKDGSVTAANSSSISDGAAALVLMRASEAKSRGLAVRATIRGHAFHAGEPCRFTTAPVDAIRILLEQVGWSVDEVDLFEINEAFAVVTMAAIQELGLRGERVNVHGGACALGHPIGASGARILTTLIAALGRRGLRRGVAALCIGGGEATAMAVELTSD